MRRFFGLAGLLVAILSLVLGSAATLEVDGGTLQVFNLDVDLAPPAPLEALVDIKPESLEKRSQGAPVTAMISLPAGYDAASIDPDSLRLSCSAPAACGSGEVTAVEAKKHGKNELKATFARSAVLALVQDVLAPSEVVLTVSGRAGGLTFAGSDDVRLVDPDPTPTPTATATPVPSATATPLPTVTPTATATPPAPEAPAGTDRRSQPADTPTATPEPTSSATALPSPTATATVSPTAKVTGTATAIASATSTVEATPTEEAAESPTPAATEATTPTATVEPDASETAMAQPVATATATVTPLPPDETPTPAPPAPTDTPDPVATEGPEGEGLGGGS